MKITDNKKIENTILEFLNIEIYFKEKKNVKSVPIEFREAFIKLLDKYYPKWNTASYEFLNK